MFKNNIHFLKKLLLWFFKCARMGNIYNISSQFKYMEILFSQTNWLIEFNFNCKHYIVAILCAVRSTSGTQGKQIKRCCKLCLIPKNGRKEREMTGTPQERDTRLYLMIASFLLESLLELSMNQIKASVSGAAPNFFQFPSLTLIHNPLNFHNFLWTENN